MLIVLLRTVILYLAVFFMIRIMGKRQVGEMQPNELVIAIMAAEIASTPLESVDIPLFYGLIPLFVMFFIEALMTFLILKNHVSRRILTGKPSLIMKDGVLQEGEMKRLRITISDLFEQARSHGYPKLHELKYIVFETNGDMSMIPNEDISYPVTLIADGKRLYKNFKDWNISESWLNEELHRNGISSDKELFLAYVDEQKLYFHRKGH
ncbi:DUF421 domain-containing protein [Alkalibaculum sp. M08DMB]|uniref:DUF421 domain-containing protein n=1 Tax=Alkalibaculum sporogenes TaxID=2655001 RepID=A0A6A7KD47_9FIRM|nr:DUF421 domain-containing protein [Alkalibaculum sporogenes]MPW27275.1 DUF421 domain-containing protein [Alkalibaculum sporogenes]